MSRGTAVAGAVADDGAAAVDGGCLEELPARVGRQEAVQVDQHGAAGLPEEGGDASHRDQPVFARSPFLGIPAAAALRGRWPMESSERRKRPAFGSDQETGIFPTFFLAG